MQSMEHEVQLQSFNKGEVMSKLDINGRFHALEKQLKTARRLSVAALAVPAVLAVCAFAVQNAPGEIIATRVTVVDDQGVTRVTIGQDPADTQRMSRAAGITLYDSTGTERGGMSTYDDNSVGLALDAPAGVGSPMRDRIGMKVYPTGSAQLLLIDNQTRGVVRLRLNPGNEGPASGGVDLFSWEPDTLKTRTITFEGETRAEQSRQ